VTATDDDYRSFIQSKAPRARACGLDGDLDINEKLYDFQRHCAEFALRQGRSGCFLDTGLGKTVVQLEFCRAAVEKIGGSAIILTPLAVAWQIKAEADRFGIESRVVRDRADVKPGINICNYDRIDRLDLELFDVVSLDESSILKSFTGKTCKELISAFSGARFRMAATATPAPNDHMELGNHAEFLGVMSSTEMLMRFFINDTSTASQCWRIKAHGERHFWDWMASWSRMAGRPDDLGFDGSAFRLPALRVHRHRTTAPAHVFVAGELFASAPSATTLHDIKRQTIDARADVAAEIAAGSAPVVIWCDTNYEADALKSRIPDAVDVRGSMPIAEKEEKLAAFTSGDAVKIITKPSIAGFGLNWQHCARQVFVGRSFSYESFYQAVRRCWRFGQQSAVDVHLVVAEGEDEIGRVVDRKAVDHELMKRKMADAMRRSTGANVDIKVAYNPQFKGSIPSWLSA
jgi:superfamily II DNA or RNA helicase